MVKVIIEKLNEEKISERKIRQWPIWTKEVSRFEWFYDSEEECLILEGEVIVHAEDGDFAFKAGDFVTFKKGLKCVWDVKSPVRKHYNFK